MDSLENENVCSVKKEDNLDFYRIHTVWMKDKFRINIASKNGAWTGEMTPENIKEFSGNLQMDEDKYLTECKEALTADDGKKGYSYAVENGCFNWKKMIDEDSGMKVKMGSVMLQPSSFTETLQHIIEVSLKHKKNLKQQVDSLLKNKKSDSQRINDLQMKLEELIDKKNIMEGDLYSKFLVLLNSKKKRIQELEESLYSIKDKTKLKKQEEKSQNSDNHSHTQSLDPYEMDTEDDEDDDDDDHSKVPEVKKPVMKCTNTQPDKEKGSSFKSETIKIISETDLNVGSEKPTTNTHNNEHNGKCDIPEQLSEESIPEAKCSNTKNLNNVKKKDDILGFFFG